MYEVFQYVLVYFVVVSQVFTKYKLFSDESSWIQFTDSSTKPEFSKLEYEVYTESEEEYQRGMEDNLQRLQYYPDITYTCYCLFLQASLVP